MLATSLFLLFGLVLLSISVAASLGLLGLILGAIYSPMPLYRGLADIVWVNAIEFLLLAIPLFVFMGEVLLRSGIAARMYEALTKWLAWLPGGLMHTNVGASALFAATSGSSVATAATIGTVALPEAESRGYNERLFLGSLTSGGTLGILIPPSINLIIFGLLTNTSVPDLYMAGLVPGLLMASIFTMTVLVACLMRPGWGGARITCTWAERLRALPELIPPVLIFLLVVGSIYGGLATPTEAAGLGVVGALVLAGARKALSWPMLLSAAEATMRTTAMVMLIVLAAMFLNFVLGVIGLTQALASFVAQLGWSPTAMMFAIVVFYLILGCFLETLSMLITTAPLITPIVIGLGFDPVWFGVLMMVLLEMALLTPPIGINLYVVQSVRRKGTLTDVVIGTLPFLAAMMVMVVLLIAFPGIALWLPKALG
ncbi:TRAP transporter large permease subunit [Pseudooceanicola sp. 216_PA32_1]|uniref:TRAP transporter large permease protein n=1 Tax=Pseudooceanicola pacificus TaxID=2676438 RepID=A0A844WF48_9RHOB|nr:TRAP transporter large permease [Pseudooceanicola pacificus]MWB77959.1 TRAP transporter large permease subunit [Pseudooceanicola pacificus]